MITLKSEKTNLMDLSFEELRNVAWEAIDADSFAKEINNPNFIARVMYADKNILVQLSKNDDFIAISNEYMISKMLDVRLLNENNFKLSSSMFQDRKQFSLEFIEKYINNIHINYLEYQSCITPEFLDIHYDRMDVDEFWDNFFSTIGAERAAQFVTYKNGQFCDLVMSSESLRYATAEDLTTLGLPVPDYYNTVMTEQRVMSGEPCGDGQRSFTIWLRKYRRVFNDPKGYPTWNNLLELFKRHPRMNQHDYVEWLFERALKKSEERVSEFSETLSFNAATVEREVYANITGSETAQEDYEIEFSDVLHPEMNEDVQVNSTENELVEILNAGFPPVDANPLTWLNMSFPVVEVTPARVQPRDPVTGRFISTRNESN